MPPAPASGPAALVRDSKTNCRDYHRPVGRPIAPGAVAGM